jgi:hypothetical protein
MMSDSIGALKRLKLIIMTEDKDRREKLYKEWVDQWVENYYENQLILDTTKIPSSLKDMFMMKITQDIVLKMLEECVNVNVQARKIEAEMLILRKTPKKK